MGENPPSDETREVRSPSGNDRTYTITVRATDFSGNSSTATVQVKVTQSNNGNH